MWSISLCGVAVTSDPGVISRSLAREFFHMPNRVLALNQRQKPQGKENIYSMSPIKASRLKWTLAPRSMTEATVKIKGILNVIINTEWATANLVQPIADKISWLDAKPEIQRLHGELTWRPWYDVQSLGAYTLPRMFLLGCLVVVQFLLVDKTRAFHRNEDRCEGLGSLVLQRRSLFQRRGTHTHPVNGAKEGK